MSDRKKSWWCRFRNFVIALAVMDTIWVLALFQWSYAIGEEQTPADTDSVAVLYSDFGPILHRTLRSIERAISVRSKNPDVVILSIGGNRLTSGQRWGNSVVEQLRAHGMPSARIVQDFESYDTRTNVLAIKAIAESHGLKSISVVAHLAHRPRVAYYWNKGTPQPRIALVLPTATSGYLTMAFDFWLTAQHEAIAWLGLALPNSVADALIRDVRR